MRRAVALTLLAGLALAPTAEPRSSAAPAPCAPAAVGKRLNTMVAGLNGGRGDRFASGFAADGRWQPYTRTVGAPGVVGRRKITQLATISIGAEADWALSALRRVAGGRYTVTASITANEQPWGRGTTRVTVDCRSGLVRSWIGPALKHPLPVDDD